MFGVIQCISGHWHVGMPGLCMRSSTMEPAPWASRNLCWVPRSHTCRTAGVLRWDDRCGCYLYVIFIGKWVGLKFGIRTSTHKMVSLMTNNLTGVDEFNGQSTRDPILVPCPIARNRVICYCAIIWTIFSGEPSTTTLKKNICFCDVPKRNIWGDRVVRILGGVKI